MEKVSKILETFSIRETFVSEKMNGNQRASTEPNQSIENDLNQQTDGFQR